MISGVRTLQVEQRDGGVLNFAELPFRLARVYWLTGPSPARGAHAHKNLRQVMFCVSGEVSVEFRDDEESETLVLTPGLGIVVDPGLWRDVRPLRFGDILVVGASDHFDEADYIRNFEEFLRWKNA